MVVPMKTINHPLFRDTTVPAPPDDWRSLKWGYTIHHCVDCGAPQSAVAVDEGLILGIVNCPVCGGQAAITAVRTPGKGGDIPSLYPAPHAQWFIHKEDHGDEFDEKLGWKISEFFAKGGLSMGLRDDREPITEGKISIFYPPQAERLGKKIKIINLNKE